MAEESFPVVEQPMSAGQWKSVTLGIGNGVLDEGGNPYRVESVSNSGNTVTVKVDRSTGYAHAILNGFYHKIDADVVLSIPAVTSTTTYRIVLEYAPDRSVPVQLKAVTSLDYSSGKNYILLHTIRRAANQLLTDATIVNYRPKIGPTVVVDSADLLPPVEHVMWGTLVFVLHPTFQLFRAGVNTMGDAPGDLKWYSVLDPEWEEFGDTSTYVYPGHGAPRAIQKVGTVRRLRGRIARKSGEVFNSGNSTGYLMMSLTAGDRPRHTQAFITTVSGTSNPGYARIEVSALTGEVRAWVAQNASWVSLDGIVFDTE